MGPLGGPQSDMGIPWWLSSKESTCNAGDAGLILGLGGFPGGRNGNWLQYSCLENPMDRGAWWATGHGGHKIIRYDSETKQQPSQEERIGTQTHTRTCAAAAAAAKLLQSCPTLRDPIDGSPPGPAVPGILQARTPEWVAISSSNAWKWKVKVKSLSRVRPSATPWTAAYQAPPSMGFSRQEYWSGVPLPSPQEHVRTQ